MRQGFSLVELAVVLVILGMLAGGVLAGQSLIRASQMRAASTDVTRYTTAIGNFRTKYEGAPGDIDNAQSIWGAAATCPGTSATPSTSAATCNGNGDGLLSASVSTSNEVFRFWQHLANAGLIEGSYTGTTGNTTATSQVAIVGTNVPSSKVSNGGWSAWASTSNGTVPIGNTTWFDGFYGVALIFGAPQASGPTQDPVLRPEEAWNIDSKLDDGKPALGQIRSYESQGNTSATGCSNLAASNSVSLPGSEYQLDNATIACTLMILSGS